MDFGIILVVDTNNVVICLSLSPLISIGGSGEQGNIGKISKGT